MDLARFPAVVLVHGSGPHDRDETLGANKLFRDIAEGLASRGIAVLRYDKRTEVYSQQVASLKDLTVEQETIGDALEALRFLGTQREIDPKRLFVLGHSLGAYLGPRIAERDPQIAGLIIMAGITRPLEDVIFAQYKYIGAPPDQLERVKQQVAEIHELKSAEGPPILGVPRSYWLDLNSYDPKADVRKLHCRILVLQGERDYQVTKPDYVGWQNALGVIRRPRLSLSSVESSLHFGGRQEYVERVRQPRARRAGSDQRHCGMDQELGCRFVGAAVVGFIDGSRPYTSTAPLVAT
jgi:hypothetical protein